MSSELLLDLLSEQSIVFVKGWFKRHLALIGGKTNMLRQRQFHSDLTRATRATRVIVLIKSSQIYPNRPQRGIRVIRAIRAIVSLMEWELTSR